MSGWQQKEGRSPMSRKVVLSGDPPVEITLRSSARMRRISLRVSRTDGAVTLSHPSWTSAEDALAFARTKSDWIRRTLVATAPAHELRFGGSVPVAGVARRIVQGAGRAAVLGAETIALPGDEGDIARRLATYLRLWARDAWRRPATGMRTLSDGRIRRWSCATRGRVGDHVRRKGD
jgi:predicted metal-dependent hydrolase